MTVTNIPISKILPPEPHLRYFKESELPFLELVDQIREYGGSYQIPPARKLENGFARLCDGNRRFKGHIAAELTHMRLDVREMTDAEYLSIQMACNSMHKPTDRIDFARHLERLQTLLGPDSTLDQLAEACKRSTSWVKNTLRLNHLHKDFGILVQRGEVTVSNALWLAKMPWHTQRDYINDAKEMTASEFSKVIRLALKDYREGVAAAKLEDLNHRHLRLRMRNLKLIESELDDPSNLPLLLVSQGITDPLEAALFGIKWAFCFDPASLQERAEKVLTMEARRINDAARRKQDRDSRRSSEIRG